MDLFPSPPTPLWLLVASGKSAKAFRVRRAIYDRPSSWTRKHPQETQSRALVLEPVPGFALKADSRASFETGESEHTNTPHADVIEDIKAQLAKRIAQRLEDAAAKQSFRHLLLAAPPRLLARLKGALSPTVRARICGEIPKDVTGYNPKNEHLIERIEKTLPVSHRP